MSILHHLTEGLPNLCVSEVSNFMIFNLFNFRLKNVITYTRKIF